MGQISLNLAARLSSHQQALCELRATVDARQVPAHASIRNRIQRGFDPLHATYATVQNLVLRFAESLSATEELAPYHEIIVAAQDQYVPAGPPLSPVTSEYFKSWALFDVRFGPDLETIGSCLLNLAGLLSLDQRTVDVVQQLQLSRMGIYEHCGFDDARCVLTELVTGERFECHVASGYEGSPGEIWFVRLYAPIDDGESYHVAFTTPYVLTDTTKTDWTAYLKKSILGNVAPDILAALHKFMKYGRDRTIWNDFILQAYHHHQADAIFLAGLPDVQDSRPHGR